MKYSYQCRCFDAAGRDNEDRKPIKVVQVNAPTPEEAEQAAIDHATGLIRDGEFVLVNITETHEDGVPVKILQIDNGGLDDGETQADPYVMRLEDMFKQQHILRALSGDPDAIERLDWSSRQIRDDSHDMERKFRMGELYAETYGYNDTYIVRVYDTVKFARQTTGDEMPFHSCYATVSEVIARTGDRFTNIELLNLDNEVVAKFERGVNGLFRVYNATGELLEEPAYRSPESDVTETIYTSGDPLNFNPNGDINPEDN